MQINVKVSGLSKTLTSVHLSTLFQKEVYFLTVEFAVDLGSGLRWAMLTVLCDQ
jgi:hypothetical protein